MRLAALFSGGKDSTYAAHIVEEQGQDVHVLITMLPSRGDSWMFHTVNTHLTGLLAEALDKPLLAVTTSGLKERELESLEDALRGLSIDGVITGAIASSYQRSRVDLICDRLGLRHIAPLWGKDPYEILCDEIRSGLEIIVSVVAAAGLDRKWLGTRLDGVAAEELIKLHHSYGLNIAGEGGEYETLVVNAPWFRKRLNILRADISWDGTRGEYTVREAKLQSKF